MTELITIFSSNIPVDCYIVKGRLESEGIPCFIFDEFSISVYPFRAVAIGGVKLKIPSDRINQSRKVLHLIEKSLLIDESGEYLMTEVFENEIRRQNEILILKHKIRTDPSLLEKEINNTSPTIDQTELEEIFSREREFFRLSQKKFIFSWKSFFYELFDFDRSVFKYLRPKPVEFYIEKEIVDNYVNQSETKEISHCPNCNSDNVAFGYAIDFKWDFMYLIISLILLVPFFLYRKKYHCFECGFNFKNIRK